LDGGVLHCSIYKYDLCTECEQAARNAAKFLVEEKRKTKMIIMGDGHSQLTCFKTHFLEKVYQCYENNEYTCENCSNQLNNEDDGIFHCIECHYDICGHVANSETQLKSDNPQRFSKDCESGYRLVLTKVLHGYTHFVANTTYKEDKYVRDKCNTLFDVQCIMILIYLTFVPIVLQNIKTRKLWSCIVWQDIPWSRLKI